MIWTTRSARYASLLAIVAMIALLLTPYLFRRTIAQTRLEITSALEPAREAASDGRLALARQNAAITGYLVVSDIRLFDEYRIARDLEEKALSRLATIEDLDSTITALAQQTEVAAHDWNAVNDRLVSGAIPASGFSTRLPDQQVKYAAAIDQAERLDSAISSAIGDVRSRIERTEGRWADASSILVLLGAVAAILVILTVRAAAQQTVLARTDPLTELYNRRGFAELAERELNRALRYDSPITLMTLDLDGFKAVNDERGHSVGDRLLKAVAQGIQETIRQVDLPARLGGDEFAILLPDNKANPPERAVERIRDAIMKRLAMDHWPVTLSVGAVTLNGPRRDIDTLIHDSDTMMYQVKAAGKNSIRHLLLEAAPADGIEVKPARLSGDSEAKR